MDSSLLRSSPKLLGPIIPWQFLWQQRRHPHLYQGGDHDSDWPGTHRERNERRAVLALVIGGAGASIPELTLLSAIFEKKLLAAFVLTIFCIAVAAGHMANLLAL